jgi:Zn-dependent protease/CBS domain-containing protein
VAGTAVYVHATFLILIGWIAMSEWFGTHSLRGVMQALALTLALFACIVAHELGHALVARRYGIRTRDIILLPIGGIGRLERTPDDPRQEFWVALAGPATSLGIALALLVILVATDRIPQLQGLDVRAGPFVERLMAVNVLLALFNLLPAFPMDGGRVLRGLLAMRLEYVRATMIAARVGQGLALAMTVLGAFVSPILLLIGVFVWIGAAQEASSIQVKSALRGIPVATVMRTDFSTLAPDDPLSGAADLAVRHGQPDFPVVADHRVVGVLTRDDLLRALSAHGPSATVADAMSPVVETVDAVDMVETTLGRLQGRAFRMMPVTEHGKLVGLLTADAIGDFLKLSLAQRGRRRSSTAQDTTASRKGGSHDERLQVES